MLTLNPIKVLRDRRLNYLMAVEKSYKDLGYSTKLDVRCNVLEVFPKGCIVPQSKEEMMIENWID